MDTILLRVTEQWVYRAAIADSYHLHFNLLIISIFTTRPCSTGVRTIVVSIWQCALFSNLMFCVLFNHKSAHT